MTWFEWLMLALIFGLCAVVCVLVDRMRRKDGILPGGL